MPESLCIYPCREVEVDMLLKVQFTRGSCSSCICASNELFLQVQPRIHPPFFLKLRQFHVGSNTCEMPPGWSLTAGTAPRILQTASVVADLNCMRRNRELAIITLCKSGLRGCSADVPACPVPCYHFYVYLSSILFFPDLVSSHEHILPPFFSLDEGRMWPLA